MFAREPVAPGRLRIKVCGITNAEDAAAAIGAGADALGFNCYRLSKRWVDLENEASWIADLPAEVRRVAIVVDPTWDDALTIARRPFIDALQLHGRENAEFCARLAGEGVCFAKALPATDGAMLDRAESFATDTIVLDSAFRGAFGGTGRTFPWSVARDFIERNPELRVVLAGGLSPDNVQEAIRFARPFGVDVTSGIECTPGRKDHSLLRRFIDAARAV